MALVSSGTKMDTEGTSWKKLSTADSPFQQKVIETGNAEGHYPIAVLTEVSYLAVFCCPYLSLLGLNAVVVT